MIESREKFEEEGDHGCGCADVHDIGMGHVLRDDDKDETCHADVKGGVVKGEDDIYGRGNNHATNIWKIGENEGSCQDLQLDQ